jgi:DNA-binding transcriptional MerR regulator
VLASLSKTSKAVLLCAVALLALSFVSIYIVSAENEDESASIDTEGGGFFAMRGWRMPFGRVMGNLTEEKRDELASEIQDLISSKLDEWGIEPPEPLLTEEQRSELRTGIEQLRENGATPEEIREFIAENLEEYGIELPEWPNDSCRFQRGGRFMNRTLEPVLTEEQRSELRDGIEELREAGATPEETKEFVNGKLEDWGVELPEPPENPGMFQRGGRFGLEKPVGPMIRGNNDDTS